MRGEIMAGKRILLTGAAGYIGKKTVEALCEKDWVDMLIGTDIAVPDFKHPKYTFITRDIRDSFDDIFEKESIDTIVHMAYALTPIHDKILMEDINKGGTMNMLDASVRHGVRQILYTSSATAYGFHPDNDNPLSEDSALRGNDDFIYAKNKKEIEAIISTFETDHPEIIVSVVRPCFVVGPGFTNVLAEHLQKKLVALPANGCELQFVHEDDLINIMTLLLAKEKPGKFNVAGEGTMSFKDMVSMLGNIYIPVPFPLLYPLNNLAWKLRLAFLSKFPSPAIRMMRHPWIVTRDKVINETGYEYQYTTREGFADFVRSVNA